MIFGQLHLHTMASDGNITPEILARSGLGFAAITDHDTMEGIALFQHLAGNGIQIIPGIELSLFFSKKKVHIVVLLPKITPFFQRAIETLMEQRRARYAKIIRGLIDLGFNTDRVSMVSRKIPSRTDVIAAIRSHPANQSLLKRYQISDEKSFRRVFFLHGGPVDIKIEGLPAESVLPAIGGIRILAHPGRSLRLPEEKGGVYEIVKAFDLAGIEVETRKHRQEDKAFLKKVADELNVVPVTANDVHQEAHLHNNQTPWDQFCDLRSLAGI